MAGYSEIALVRTMSYLAESQAAVANNLANATTFGFKRRVPVTAEAAASFQSMLNNDMPSVYYTEQVDFKTGIQRPTGETFHIAIEDTINPNLRPEDQLEEQNKATFIEVQHPSTNKTYLSRGGVLSVDSEGYLMAGDKQVLSETKQPIQIGLAFDIKIESSGLITGRVPNGSKSVSTELGKIGLYRVSKQDLRPVGSSTYAIDSSRPIDRAHFARIRQGFIEQSNVNPIDELVRMITVQRSFTGTQKALTSISRIQESFISTISR